MARIFVVSLCVLFLAFAYAENEEQPSSVEEADDSLNLNEDALKNDTADGRRHKHKHHHRYHDHDYGYGGYRYGPPVLNHNVCDLDASVLLVTGHAHHGHNKAHRVRCSEVSAADADSCNVCCRHAARRDRNLKNDEIVGLLMVSEHNHKEHNRHKRGSGLGDYEGFSMSVHNLPVFPKDASDPQYYKNVKCMCCAPKRPFNPPPVPFYQAPPMYQPRPFYAPSQPLYGVAQAPPQSQYAAPIPVAAQPQYNGPPASQPIYVVPQASQPQYNGPAASQPQYNGPAASQPQYNGPAASAPLYNGPAASPPQYNGPAASQPQYNGPAASQPQYNGPAASQPDYNGPPAAQPIPFQQPAQAPQQY